MKTIWVIPREQHEVPKDAQCSETYAKNNFLIKKILISGFSDLTDFSTKKLDEKFKLAPISFKLGSAN